MFNQILGLHISEPVRGAFSASEGPTIWQIIIIIIIIIIIVIMSKWLGALQLPVLRPGDSRNAWVSREWISVPM